MAALAVLSGIGLFLPHHWEIAMGVAEWTGKYRVYEWIVLLFAVIWVSISGIEFLYFLENTRRKLHSLPRDQKEVLRFYAEQNLSAHPWFVSQLGPRALESEGILTLLPKPPVSDQNAPKLDGILNYKIQPWILRYLTKRPQLVAK